MSKGDKEGFIVKFVESEGRKTEYAVKAYEVNHPAPSYHRSPVSVSVVRDVIIIIIILLCCVQAILELQSDKYLKSIEEDAVLQMDEKDKSLFVFSTFTSPAFLHCKKVSATHGNLNLDSHRNRREAIMEILLFFLCSLSCSSAAGS